MTLTVLAATGAVATRSDLSQRIIPNCLLLTSGVVLLVLSIIAGDVPASLLGAAVLSVVASLGVASGGLGMGDLKYLAVVGLGLGPVVGLFALFIAALAAAAWHLPLVLRKGPRVTFPFGPFIALGSVLAPLILAMLCR